MATNVYAGRAGDVRFAATTAATAVTLGKMRNWSIDVSGDPIECTNFDSGGWKEYVDAGSRNWTLSVESIHCSTALSTSVSQDNFRSAMSSGTRQYWTVYDNTSTVAGASVFRGWGYTGGWTLGGELDGPVITGFSVTGDGALTEATS